MTIDIADALRSIGVCASREALLAMLSHATKSRLSLAQVVEQLVDLERRERALRNLAGRTRQATLGALKSLDRFDWNFPRTLDRAAYERLLTLDFATRGENVLLRGPSGVGKTTLAQNRGSSRPRKRKVGLLLHRQFGAFRSAQAGVATRGGTTPQAIHDARHPHLGRTRIHPVRRSLWDLLYTIISRRHERVSTVITTSLAFKDWGSVFPGAACVVALVDRFTQHCHTLDIDGDSWRQRPDPTPRIVTATKKRKALR